MFQFLSKLKLTLSTDILFAALTVFIFITFFLCFVIAGVYRHSSPARAFMWIKAMGAGTFFSYGNICLQAHGAEVYSSEFLGIKGLAVWVQPIVFGLLVCFESHWFCLFHVKTAVASMRDAAQYSPLLHDGSEHSNGSDEDSSFDEDYSTISNNGHIELVISDTSPHRSSDSSSNGASGASTNKGGGLAGGGGGVDVSCEDFDDFGDDSDSFSNTPSHGRVDGRSTSSSSGGGGGSSSGSDRDSRGAEASATDDDRNSSLGVEGAATAGRLVDPHVLAAIQARNAEESGFPLLPTLALACLEGFAVGFEMGDIPRGVPQFAWKYLHLVFNKCMLGLGWGALLQSRLGERKEYLTFLSMLLLAASTPFGLMVGQIYHKVDDHILRQPMVLDTIFCAASGMYLYLACFPLGDDWRARKITGVLTAVLVGVLANSYVDALRPHDAEDMTLPGM